MKTIIAYAAPFAMALSFTTAMPTASAAPGGSSGLAQACNSGLADAFGVTVGTCIQIFRDTDPVSLCKFLKDTDLLDLTGFRNQGQCIKALGS